MNTENSTHHILPLSVYLKIGATLIILTGLTVWIASLDFGPYNLLIAMAIAATKASLVALYFMHLKYDNKLYSMFFVAGIFCLAVFIIITMFDTLRRDDIYEIKSGPINKDAVIYQDQIDSTQLLIEATSDSTTTAVNEND
jgi:cytochrome c oxidase subunit 4